MTSSSFSTGERQFVVGIFTPVWLAIHGVKVETILGSFLAPVGTFDNVDSFHGHQPPIERVEVPLALRCIEAACLATD